MLTEKNAVEVVEGSSSSACEDSERFKSVRALSYGGRKRVFKLELVKTDPVGREQ